MTEMNHDTMAAHTTSIPWQTQSGCALFGTNVRLPCHVVVERGRACLCRCRVSLLTCGHPVPPGNQWHVCFGRVCLPRVCLVGLGRDALEEGKTPPLQGAQPIPSHCLPDGNCQSLRHLQPTVTAPNRFRNILQPPA